MSNVMDPQATLDWAWDWTAWLAESETITAHTVTVTSGTAVVDDIDESAGVVTAWISNPEPGRIALTCHIETSDGRVDDRTKRISIQQR